MVAMRRVLVLTKMYPTKSLPTLGTFVKAHVDGWRAAGIDVTVVSAGEGSNRVMTGLRCVVFALMGVVRLMSRRYDLCYVHFSSLGALPLLVCHHWITCPPIVVNVHGSYVLPCERKHQSVGRMHRTLSRYAVAIADVVVVPSRYFSRVVQVVARCPQYKIIESPSGGVGGQFFELHDYVPEEAPVDSGTLRIGYVGRVNAEKGVSDCLEAVRLLIDRGAGMVTLDLVGPVEDNAWLRAQIEARGLTQLVQVHGPQRWSELPDWYRRWDLTLFLTTRRSESLGLVALESMACAVPVVAARVGAVGSFVRDGRNGYLVDPHSPGQVADILSRYMVQERDQRRELRLNARESVMQLRTEVVLDDLRSALSDRLEVLEGAAQR